MQGWATVLVTGNGSMQSHLVAKARESFDLGDEDVSITPDARGARGEVWRLTTRRRVYALKHVFAVLGSA